MRAKRDRMDCFLPERSKRKQDNSEAATAILGDKGLITKEGQRMPEALSAPLIFRNPWNARDMRI